MSQNPPELPREPAKRPLHRARAALSHHQRHHERLAREVGQRYSARQNPPAVS
jgi:hypothetical protein